MRYLLKNLALFLFPSVLMLSSCQKEELEVKQDTTTITQRQHRSGTITCGESTTVKLIAGQYIEAGTVTVSNNSSNLLVTYASTGGWRIQELHLFVGDCMSIPVNKSGNPVPGQFPYKTSFSSGGVTSYTFSIPLSTLPQCFCVAAHAVVSNPTLGTETAWGEGSRIVSKGNWAMKFNACIQACGPQPQGCAFPPDLRLFRPTFNSVSVAGFTYTQAEALDIFNAPTTDGRIAFIYTAAIKLSGNQVATTATVWQNVAVVELWLATVGKLNANSLPNAPSNVQDDINAIKNWVEQYTCES